MDLDRANIQKALKHIENNKPKENQRADKKRRKKNPWRIDRKDWDVNKISHNFEKERNFIAFVTFKRTFRAIKQTKKKILKTLQ